MRRSGAAGRDLQLERTRLLSVTLEVGHSRGETVKMRDVMKNNHPEKQHHVTERARPSGQMSIRCLIYCRRRHEETVSAAHPSLVMSCLMGGPLRFTPRLPRGALYVDINNKILREGPSIAVCTEGNSPPDQRFIKTLPRRFEPLKHRQAAASERVEV